MPLSQREACALPRIRPQLFLVALFAAIACLGISVKPTHAATTCTFTGAVSSDWNTSGNWDCAATPSSTTDVIIPAATSTALSAPVVISTLNVGAGSLVTMGSNSLTVENSATNTGSIVTGLGALILNDISGTTTNTGLIDATTTITTVYFFGDVVNTGTLALGSSTMNFYSGWNNAGGTFTSGNFGVLDFLGGKAQSLPNGITFGFLEVNKTAGTILTMLGSATTTRDVAIVSGTLSLSGTPSDTLSVGHNWSDTGLLTGTGTVKFNGIATTQSVSAEPHFDNVIVDSNPGPVSMGGDVTVLGNLTVLLGTLDAGGHLLTVDGTVNNAGTVSLTGGAGTFNSTTTNSGTLVNGSGGTFHFNGDLVNTNLLNQGGGSLVFVAGWNNAGGTLMSSGTVNFIGGAAQTMPDGITMGSLVVSKAAGTTVTMAGNATTTGVVDLTSGILAMSGAFGTLNVGGNWSNTGGVLNAPSISQVIFNGTGPQTISAEPGFNFLEVQKASGTATLTGNVRAAVLDLFSGTLALGSNTLTVTGSGTGGAHPVTIVGTFEPDTGTFAYAGSAATDIQPATYYNLTLQNAGPFNLTASTTAVGATNIGVGSTLAVGGNSLTAVGLITNNGLITEGAGGTIIHAAESLTVADNLGNANTVAPPNNLVITLQDSDRNLNGAAIDTVTSSVAFNAAAGSDSEIVTLTETAANSGIFRSSKSVSQVSTATPGDGNYQITAAGSGTVTYTDAVDGTDTKNAAFTVTLPTAVVVGGGGGGGGGLGSPGTPALAPLQTTYQTNLQNLANQGIAVNSLIKLPCLTAAAGNDPNDACKAVYFIGTDGKRHAFPNDKVYFTWYVDFSGVQLVNATQLASIPLGANVTYKPGVKMVKFTTDPKVYVVAKGGVLRWVATEAVATELYGANWNHMIDDISDAFYSNYTFGTSVSGLADFNPAAVQASVQFPSDSLQM